MKGGGSHPAQTYPTLTTHGIHFQFVISPSTNIGARRPGIIPPPASRHACITCITCIACIWYNNNATGLNVYIYIIYIKQKKFFYFLYILIKNYNLWWLKCSFFESTYIKIYIFCIYSVLFKGIYGVL